MSQRKHRRKIKRRKRNKRSFRKRKNFLERHLSGTVTDRYTKLTTLIIIGLEVTWVALELIWFTIDMLYGGYWQ